MSKKYIVEDFMRHDVITIAPTATIAEAVHIMLEHRTNALVVTNANNAIAGMLTSWGIIEHLVPDYLEEDKHLASFESGEVFPERVQWMKDHPVAEIMSTNVHTVNASDSLMETATQVSQHHIRQLPVIDDAGKLVGYINHTDIKRAIGEVLGEDEALLS